MLSLCAGPQLPARFYSKVCFWGFSIGFFEKLFISTQQHALSTPVIQIFCAREISQLSFCQSVSLQVCSGLEMTPTLFLCSLAELWVAAMTSLMPSSLCRKHNDGAVLWGSLCVLWWFLHADSKDFREECFYSLSVPPPFGWLPAQSFLPGASAERKSKWEEKQMPPVPDHA